MSAEMPLFIRNEDGTMRAEWPDPLEPFYPVSVELLKQWVEDKNEMVRLRVAVHESEWAEVFSDYSVGDFICGACGNTRDFGHEHGCSVAVALCEIENDGARA